MKDPVFGTPFHPGLRSTPALGRREAQGLCQDEAVAGVSGASRRRIVELSQTRRSNFRRAWRGFAQRRRRSGSLRAEMAGALRRLSAARVSPVCAAACGGAC